METRIDTSALFMMDLLHDITAGRAAPAAFQRPFVWTREDVEAMWTSIIRGYPLGAFLLWRPLDGGAHGRQTLGPIPLATDRRSALILDGQNRLVTIAWSMTDPNEDILADAPGRDVFLGDDGLRLMLDPETRLARFIHPDDAHRLAMPIHMLFGRISAFQREAWRNDGDDEIMEWIDKVGYRLREARIVKTTIENATPEEAKEAFLHISRAGVPMSQADFETALAYGAHAS